jgi:RNA polymerase sigma factor (sigma-70 family)
VRGSARHIPTSDRDPLDRRKRLHPPVHWPQPALIVVRQPSETTPSTQGERIELSDKCERQWDTLLDDLVLDEALSLLWPRQRAVLVLYYFQGRTDGEIAELLHTTATAINKCRNRTLAVLRARMEGP